MRNRPNVRFTLLAILCLASTPLLAQTPPAEQSDPSALPQMPQMEPMPQQTDQPPQQELPPDPTVGIERLPIDEQLRMALAYRAYNKEPEWTRAMSVLANVLKEDPTNIEAHLQIAEISMDRRDFNVARDYFKKVRSLDENNFRANVGLGKYYLYTRLYRQSVQYLKVAANVAPPDKKAEALQLLGTAYLESRELNSARQAIEDSLRVDGGNTQTARIYIQVLLQMQKYEEARDAALKLLQIEQMKMAQLGSLDREAVRQYAGSYDMVIQVLLELHNSLHKKNARGQITDEPLPGKEREIAQVLDAIVQIRVQQLPTVKVMSLLDILPLAQRSVQLAPDNPAYYFTLAYTCAEAGLWADARASIQRAVELEPSNQTYQNALQRIDADIARLQQQSNAQQQQMSPASPQPGTAPPPAPVR